MGLRLSREEVGARVGASVYAVRNWENNMEIPRPKYWPKIVSFLGYDPKVKTKEFYGERIREYLNSQGISRKELARRVGVTPQAVHRWIHDMSTPPERLLRQLLSILDSAFSGKKESGR